MVRKWTDYQERKFLGTFIPGSEGSHWELLLSEWKYRGAKSPDTTNFVVKTVRYLDSRDLSVLSFFIQWINWVYLFSGYDIFYVANVHAIVHVLADIMADTESADWLLDLLRDVQLEQFYVKLRDNLQVTR